MVHKNLKLTTAFHDPALEIGDSVYEKKNHHQHVHHVSVVQLVERRRGRRVSWVDDDLGSFEDSEVEEKGCSYSGNAGTHPRELEAPEAWDNGI